MSAQNDSRERDPYGAYMFKVQISPGASAPQGSVGTVVGCSEVAGLSFEIEVETLKVGGVNGGDVLLPGAAKAPLRLVLKRGYADKSYFWKWYLATMEGRIERRSITVSMMDSKGSVTEQAWSFQQACPVKWTGPELRAATSAVGFESIELIHRGLRRPA